MKKYLLIVSALFFLTACDNSADTAKQSNVGSDVSADVSTKTVEKYTTEELLGKTVEEYEQLEKEKGNETAANTQPDKLTNNGFLELTWEDLIAPGYDADTIMEKYNPLIDQLEHNSDKALALYRKMEDEFNNAPANPKLADQKVSIPGFIAPLEQVNGMITEFLLVPYFGACIHMPPPPANQTLYVKVAADYAIRNEDSYEPIWVSGQLNLDGTDTDLGTASYQIQNALISKYE